jgi:hypothetical protein
VLLCQGGCLTTPAAHLQASSGSKAGAASPAAEAAPATAKHAACVAVGYDDGSTSVFSLAAEGGGGGGGGVSRSEQLRAIERLVA